MDRVEAMKGQQINNGQLIKAAELVAADQVQITFDEFGNAQVPVSLPDMASETFKPVMKKFNMPNLLALHDHAVEEITRAQQALDFATAQRDACEVMMNKLHEVKSVANSNVAQPIEPIEPIAYG